jgi:hypothetical protein
MSITDGSLSSDDTAIAGFAFLELNWFQPAPNEQGI